MENQDNVVYKGQFHDWNIFLRRSTVADYDDVMRIDDNVYSGADILPYIYHDMLADNTAHSYTVEVNGQVSVFICFSVDGVENIMTTSTAGRVAPEYRHRGLYLFVKQLIHQDMKKKYPSLQYNWSVSLLSDRLVSLTHKANGRLLDTKNHKFCIMPLDNIGRQAEMTRGEVMVLNPGVSEVLDLLDKQDILEALYPKRIFVHAAKFLPVPTKKWHLKRALGRGIVNLSGSVESQDLALSTASVYRCRLGARIMFSYDGCPDLMTVISHLMKTVEKMARSLLVADVEKNCNVEPSVPGNRGDEEWKPKEFKLVLSILLPCAVDMDSIVKFTRDVLGCEVRDDFFPALGLYEMPYE